MTQERKNTLNLGFKLQDSALVSNKYLLSSDQLLVYAVEFNFTIPGRRNKSATISRRKHGSRRSWGLKDVGQCCWSHGCWVGKPKPKNSTVTGNKHENVVGPMHKFHVYVFLVAVEILGTGLPAQRQRGQQHHCDLTRIVQYGWWPGAPSARWWRALNHWSHWVTGVPNIYILMAN